MSSLYRSDNLCLDFWDDELLLDTNSSGHDQKYRWLGKQLKWIEKQPK